MENSLSYICWALNITAWLWTMSDIRKNEYRNDRGKMWFTLVLLLPFPAMGAYYYWGIRQKIKPPLRFAKLK